MSSYNHKRDRGLSRRSFMKTAAAAAPAAAFPAIVPSSVFGANAPSNRITIGCIGVGRMGSGDLKDFIGRDNTQIVAVCDVDRGRRETAKSGVEKYYADKKGIDYKGCGCYNEYEEIIARDDIDAVSIVTPDHWHIIPAVAAAEAKKDIFLQKPMSLTIHEGRVLSDACHRNGVVFQMGSQQRSDAKFRLACQLVRNKAVGDLKTVRVGFGMDPSCPVQPEMPVPEGLDYDRWLGQAPVKPYTEMRVHPEKGYGRPGWLRIRDYGHGMITGWGAHHLDISQWGMGREYSGPVSIEGKGGYPDPETHLWDVHTTFDIMYTYEDGIRMHVCNEYKQGVVFEGTDGWVHVKRGHIEASDRDLLKTAFGPNDVHLYESNDHKGNFLDCIRSRQLTAAPVEIGHRSCSACILGSIAMELGRKLNWDPQKETFIGDEEANGRIAVEKRAPWTL
jgi:predicted dehydrogenase